MNINMGDPPATSSTRVHLDKVDAKKKNHIDPQKKPFMISIS